MAGQPKLKTRLLELLYKPVDIAGLAVMRMLFGIIIMVEAWRYTDLLRVVAKYTYQDFYFKFRYFEWVPELPTLLMQALFVIYGLSGILIFFGLFYRFATIVATLCITYIFLVDATNYLNHFYLMIIFSFMMIFIPAHKGWSLHAYFRPQKAWQTVPGWAVWLPRAQLAIVYFYAAVAKMNVDWINGMPLYNWIGGRAVGASGIEMYLSMPIFIYFFTYAGLLYDLLVGPMLIYKRTRAFAYCLSLSFHLTNYYLFNIGIFPWFMLATTTIFFDTNWPRNFLNFFVKDRFLPVRIGQYTAFRLNLWQKAGLALMAGHIVFQIVFPLRHFAYPGYAAWNEGGHNFAWHMKLRGKQGSATFFVKDPVTGKSMQVDPARYLTDRQEKKMATRPFLLLQFAHFLRDKYTAPGEEMAEVYAETRVRVNGRDAQRMIDPEVNLSKVKPTEVPGSWILPLRQPVWNAKNKRNRFGPALKRDHWAERAIPQLAPSDTRIAQGKS